MAINAVSGASQPGPIPAEAIRVRADLPNLNNEAPLQRRPADRPASRTGVRPEPFVRTGGRLDLIL